MSGITATMISISQGLLTQVLVIVAALAALVGVSILVVYGFHHLREAALPEGVMYRTGSDDPFGPRDIGFDGEFIEHDMTDDEIAANLAEDHDGCNTED